MTDLREPDPPAIARDETAARWVAREALGALAPEDRKALAEWLVADSRNKTAYFAAQGVVESVGGAELAFRRAHRTSGVAEEKPSRGISWRASVLAASAAALAVVFFAADLTTVVADYGTAPGEIRQLILADGTKVTLDTSSAIDVTYTADARDVSVIRGRAYFEVAHEASRSFRVRAVGGVVRDIGTAFVVTHMGEAAEAHVTQGAVEVSSDNRRIMLNEGQGSRWQEGSTPVPIADFSTQQALGWRDGNITVNRQTFGSVVEELNRYRRRPIVLLNREVATRVVSGVVRTDHLEESLASLAQGQGLSTLTLPFATFLY